MPPEPRHVIGLTPARSGTSTRAPVAAALDDVAGGRMVVVMDDAAQCGAIVMAAEFADAAAITFMTRVGGGRVVLALTEDRCDALGLGPMGPRDSASAPFTVTVDAREGITTGASAQDQAHTMQVAVDPASGRGDLVVAGHVQPVRTRNGGVVEHADHANAAVDLSRLAGVRPAGVVCTIHGEDGSLATSEDVERLCVRNGLKLVTIADLVELRWRRLQVVRREVETSMPTRFGHFTAIGYRSLVDGTHHVALVKGDVAGCSDVLVRVQPECFTGDVLRSLHCDHGEQLERALRMIAAEGGALVYVTHENRLSDLVRQLTDDAASPNSSRESGIAAQILAELGPNSIRLLTDTPDRRFQLEGYGFHISAEIPIRTDPGLARRSRAS